jgi:VanZ family protein
VDRRWLVWTLFGAAGTTALLVPASVHEQLPLGEFVMTYKALFAKSLHVLFFAVFAVLSGWLRIALAWRPALMFFLMLHAAGTEFLQGFVPGRNGTVGDVLFNHLGIALGLAFSWSCWTRNDSA